MVYVDPLMVWPTTIRCFKDGSCHLFADDLAELHLFAANIGMQMRWCRFTRIPHYDLTKRRRAEAVERGVIQLSRREAVVKWREIRGKAALTAENAENAER